MPDESKSIALTSFAVIAVIALAVFILVWLRHSPSRTCADNLRQISAALGMYLDDSDQRFPPSYTAYYDDVGIHCAAWDSLIDPYIGSHIAPQAGWAYVDSWDEAVVPGSGLTTSVTPPLAPWHCPADAGAGPLSYGLNSVVSGAYKIFHTKAVAERFVRAQEWQDSLTFSQISDPNNVVWAGDTNRLWDASHKVYTEAFPEWPRRTDCYLRDLTDPQFVDWYRGFLARDLTDYEGSCPYPLAWGCRAPAYRHDTSGRRSAMMLFCDGHVRSVPVGELRVQNIFPSTELSSFGFHKNAVSADPQYTITEICSGTVYSGMHAGALSDRGEVVGGNYWDMVAWSNGKARDLQTRGTLYGVNDQGVMTGDGLYGAVQLANGTATPLGTMTGYSSTAARAINNRGQIVGRAFNGSASPWAAQCHAFLWQRGGFHDLGVPPNCVSSSAYAINDSGWVVGSAITKDNQTHAFLWRDGVMRDLGTLPGGSLSIAYGINNGGQIVGDSDRAIGRGFLFHPFLWENGHMRDLGLPAGYRYCVGKAINDSGSVVCSATDPDHVPISPLVWDPKHGMRRLDSMCPPDSGWLLRDAYAINSSGQILCWGFFHDTMSLALATPRYVTR